MTPLAQAQAAREVCDWETHAEAVALLVEARRRERIGAGNRAAFTVRRRIERLGEQLRRAEGVGG